jgi:hypothetical protein
LLRLADSDTISVPVRERFEIASSRRASGFCRRFLSAPFLPRRGGSIHGTRCDGKRLAGVTIAGGRVVYEDSQVVDAPNGGRLLVPSM